MEILGGFRLKIIGWDRRYDQYDNKEARLVFRDGEFVLCISKRIPRPDKHVPKGVLALDINERQVVAGNSEIEYRLETAIEKALHCKRLGEKGFILACKTDKKQQYAIAREDLTDLIENLRKLSKDKAGLLMLSYRKLEFWID